jgi:excisionase family DNA binding protein
VTTELENMLTVSEAARLLGISNTRVRELEREGSLPCVRTPFGRLFERRVAEQMRELRAARKDRDNG